MTAAIGVMNRLTVVRTGRAGVYLDGGARGDVLLPSKRAPDRVRAGDVLEVFVFLDSDGALAATLVPPLAQVGQVAYLRVVSVSAVGTFLDWGLPKDLLLPHGEQTFPPDVGKRVMVMVFRDEQGRVAASQRLDDFLSDEAEGLRAGEAVTLVVADRTDLGTKVVVNDRHWGLVYHDSVQRPLHKGERLPGFIRRIREDGRLDVSLEPVGAARLEGIAERVYAQLKASGGVLPLGDKSDPEAIRRAFNVSKSAYRQAIGGLYKRRLITLAPHEIRLVEGASQEKSR